MQRHHDIRLNDTCHTDIQYHKGNATLSILPLMTLSVVRLSITIPSAVCRLCWMPFMLSVGILSAIAILPHLLSVVAPTSVPILFYFEIRNFNLGCLESGKWQDVTKKKKEKKKLTLGRPALVAGIQQTLSNLYWDFRYLWSVLS